MAESHFILGLEFLHIRGGYSFIVLFFFLMLMGTCCFKAFQFAKRMLPLLRAIVNISSISKAPSQSFWLKDSAATHSREEVISNEVYTISNNCKMKAS